MVCARVAVRRVMSFSATEDLSGKAYQISFYAKDNSGRWDSAAQKSPSLCCQSSDLTSLVNVSVRLLVNNTRPAFLNPTPPSNLRYVRAGMQHIAICVLSACTHCVA